MKSRDLALLLLLGVIWGSAFLFINVVVAEVPPITVVAGRLLLATAVLLLVLRATGRPLPSRSGVAGAHLPRRHEQRIAVLAHHLG